MQRLKHLRALGVVLGNPRTSSLADARSTSTRGPIGPAEGTIHQPSSALHKDSQADIVTINRPQASVNTFSDP